MADRRIYIFGCAEVMMSRALLLRGGSIGYAPSIGTRLSLHNYKCLICTLVQEGLCLGSGGKELLWSATWRRRVEA